VSTASADPLIGRLIDGRYQVRSRIARGGMATVYLATDLRLERRVAIKVMHGHLADDSQYKARFIQEARSAARLAHPNVVNVYDQGQDGETAYLVMEYLPGITLRDLLQEHKVLTTVQAMDIMEAILGGLAAAHKNGIVHRDLKPENVLLADDGRIKIGDFGLARAATANTATGNALLGTIAYLSPELVTRGVADTRSDIYAVGIMLYEMLAGEQPFRGEQAFQIAHQHANDTVPTPSTKNPRVPAELDELVLWATARDPEQRPRDARAMLEQLHETEALLLGDTAATQATAIQQTAAQRTMVMPSAGRPGTTAETQAFAPKARHRTGPILTEATSALAVKSDRRRTRGWWLFALVIVLAALAGGTGWYFGPGPGGQITIPDVASMQPAAAASALTAVGLTVTTPYGLTDSPTIASGLVAKTQPAVGQRVVRSGSVTLLVSSGPKSLPISKLVGLDQTAAIDQIKAQQFRYDSKDSTKQFDAKAPLNQVLAATGANGVDLSKVTTYFQLQPVSLVVSAGRLPDVAGDSVDAATKTLAGSAYRLTASPGQRIYSDTIKDGLVIGIDQPSGTVIHPGDSVSLVLSQGPQPVSVPDVAGMFWSSAKPLLVAAGFALDYNQAVDMAPFFITVKSTSPGGGQLAPKGSTIKVTFVGG